MFSTIGQVRAAEAEEVPGNPEEVAEDRRQMLVRVLCPLFHGHPAVEAVVHRVAEAVLQCRVRPVRREAEAVLRQP